MESSTRHFHHPYNPYDIQNDLMNAIYDCITEGKIGIFESPTGTGKSLSLICSSLTWLRDNQEVTLQDQTTLEEESGEPGWVVEHARSQRRDAVIEQKSELEARLRKIRTKELLQKKRFETGEPKAKRVKANKDENLLDVDVEAHFGLDEYDSEDEEPKTKPVSHQAGDQGLSSASVQLMEKLGLVFKPSSESEDMLPADEVKIYFSSRTHSQLTQFVQEVRRVDLPAGSWSGKRDAPTTDAVNDKVVVKHVPLGSRKNLCINPKVSKLSSASAINERCLEMQQSDTPKDHKCPFVPNQDNETLVNDFRDHTLAQVRDIEDLGALGKRLGICPYYASRAAIKPSEVSQSQVEKAMTS